MTVVINTNAVSPHMVPFALALARLIKCGEVKYVCYSEPDDRFRTQEVYAQIKPFLLYINGGAKDVEQYLVNASVLIDGSRNFKIWERRAELSRPTYYVSERWFKSVNILSPRDSEHASNHGWSCSGFLKMLLPFAICRARKMISLLNGSGNLIYLANGVWAAMDMARMCGLMKGDWKCIFRAPALEFERFPSGRVWAKDGNDKKYCLDKIRMWGYFVEPSARPQSNIRLARQSFSDGGTIEHSNTLRVLWVGRMFGWKRLDTLIRAAGGVSGVELDIYGNGPDELEVREMASQYSNVHVYDSVLLSRVRELMREHDVYVLPSNSFEGWGAVINEALEEGMKVLGTYEAGACATILPETNLFHCGDWRTLRKKLLEVIPSVSIGPWTAENAAKELLWIARELNGEST